ncbi:MAG: hypothetical protein HC862_03165 [Scytonema sp. RU_4_4]|nr:hypothetical protein [Scytonema sp. RU_4_4]NJR74352.1 hypothetical protein [Scytonema sp. CRU_2_7]
MDKKSQRRAGVPPVEEPVRCGASTAGGFPSVGIWRWGSPRCSIWRATGVEPTPLVEARSRPSKGNFS